MFAVDHKPKSGRRLARLDNIAANPGVSLLVDHYDEDWSRLWWARADGRAAELAGADRESALDALAATYVRYQEVRPAGPVVGTRVHRWSAWAG